MGEGILLWALFTLAEHPGKLTEPPMKVTDSITAYQWLKFKGYPLSVKLEQLTSNQINKKYCILDKRIFPLVIALWHAQSLQFRKWDQNCRLGSGCSPWPALLHTRVQVVPVMGIITHGPRIFCAASGV